MDYRRRTGLAAADPATRTPAVRQVACNWQTLAVSLELAQGFCTASGRAAEGTGITEMRWWDDVRAGDALRLHAYVQPRDDPVASGANLLLWTVNQFGRCVFSCLVTSPELVEPPSSPGTAE